LLLPYFIFLPQGFIAVLLDYLVHALVDFAPAIASEPAVGAGYVVIEEQDVEQEGDKQVDQRDHPDDQSEKHAEENGKLAVASLVGEDANIDEELGEGAMSVGGRVLADWNQVQLHDRIQSHGVDDLPGALGQ
jgi:hypothetical protein